MNEFQSPGFPPQGTGFQGQLPHPPVQPEASPSGGCGNVPSGGAPQPQAYAGFPPYAVPPGAQVPGGTTPSFGAPPYGDPAPAQPLSYSGGIPGYPMAVPGGFYSQNAPAFALGGVRAPEDPRKKGASRALNRMCLLVLGQSAASFVWQMVLLAVLMLLGLNVYGDAVLYQWLTGALVPLSTALPFLLYLAARREDPGQYLKFEKIGLFSGALCVLGGLAICLLGNYPAFFLQDILKNFGYEPVNSTSLFENSWPSFLVEFFVTAIVVPVMEEFAFRGVLLSSLRRFGVGFSIVASALVFGMAHLDVSSVLFAFIAGLVFGFLYARTNNLWLTIWIHGLNNGLAVITNHSDFLFGEEMAYVAESALMLVPIAIGVLALLILLVFRRDIFITYLSPKYDGPAQPLKAGESAGCMARAPVFWIMAGLVALYTVGLCTIL